MNNYTQCHAQKMIARIYIEISHFRFFQIEGHIHLRPHAWQSTDFSGQSVRGTTNPGEKEILTVVYSVHACGNVQNFHFEDTVFG